MSLINRFSRKDSNSLQDYLSIKEEVLASFEESEILRFNDFQSFWNQVDADNGYEDEWEEWKADGVKFIYLQIYNEIKAINSLESIRAGIVNLLCDLNLNMHAFDDDLQETWKSFLESWELLKGQVESVLKEE